MTNIPCISHTKTSWIDFYHRISEGMLDALVFAFG